jgi:hypothetical protein
VEPRLQRFDHGAARRAMATGAGTLIEANGVNVTSGGSDWNETVRARPLQLLTYGGSHLIMATFC